MSAKMSGRSKINTTTKNPYTIMIPGGKKPATLSGVSHTAQLETSTTSISILDGGTYAVEFTKKKCVLEKCRWVADGGVCTDETLPLNLQEESNKVFMVRWHSGHVEHFALNNGACGPEASQNCYKNMIFMVIGSTKSIRKMFPSLPLMKRRIALVNSITQT